MAKSQKHGNREAKKPKQAKAPAPVTEGLFSKVGATGPGVNKKRG